MKSNFKKIKTNSELEKDGRFYFDKKRNCYVFINDNIVMDVIDTDKILIIKKYEKCMDKKKQKQKIEIIKTSIGLAFLLLLSRAVKYKTYDYLKDFTQEQMDYLYSDRKAEANQKLLLECMNKNKTLSSPLREELRQYMDVFAKYDSDMSIVKVATKIKFMDFSEVASIDLQVLENIFDISNGTFIAEQLYLSQEEYFYRSDYYKGLLINYLFFHEEDLEKVLQGKDLELEIDGKKYLVCFNHFDRWYPEVEDYLEKYQQDKKEEYGLSQEYWFASTIFAPITEVYSRKGNPSYFYKKENHSLVDCTDEVYIGKLSKIIEEHGVNFNYYNTLSRQLLYFYIDAYKKEKGNNLFNTKLNISSYVYYSIKNTQLDTELYNRGYYFCYEHLLQFIKQGAFPYERLQNMWDLALYYPEDTLLLQTLNACLKIEVEEGYMSEIAYERFVEMVTFVLSDYPAEYEQFCETNLFNSSVEKFTFSLLFKKEN